MIGPLQKVAPDGLYGWFVVNTVAGDADVLPRKPEVPLYVAEIVREPSSVPGKVTFACACPEPLMGIADARTVPLPALVPVLSKKVTVPPPGFGLTVAVSVTEVAVVAWPPTLVLVKTSELEPFGLAEMDVVVAVEADPVKEMDHDPSDPDGVNPEGDWLAIYSVQFPFMLLPVEPKELKLKVPLPSVLGLVPAEL